MPTLADLFRGRYLGGGADFAAIRVHCAGADVDRACRALGARAFTVGSDIYFAAGAFRPDRRDGVWLLAHEVAHVVQQSAGPVGTARGLGPGRLGLTVAPAGTAEERAADAVSLRDWHQGGLRDLCADLFGRTSTRALRVLMSGAFDRLGTPTDAGR